MQRQIFLGLGSNCGDRFANLQAAKHAMSAQIRILQCSSVYESPALLPENAPVEWDIPFFNAVMKAETDLEPLALLEFVQSIEQQLGRQHRGHWGPREIDLDILLMEGIEMQTERLTLPHKEMLKRDFVMVPLAEIINCHPALVAGSTLMLAQSDEWMLKQVQHDTITRTDLCL